MVNAIEKELFAYFMQLSEAEKNSILQMVKTFVREKNGGVEIDVEQYNRDIEEALMDIAKGNFITQDQMEHKVSKW